MPADPDLPDDLSEVVRDARDAVEILSMRFEHMAKELDLLVRERDALRVAIQRIIDNDRCHASRCAVICGKGKCDCRMSIAREALAGLRDQGGGS